MISTIKQLIHCLIPCYRNADNANNGMLREYWLHEINRLCKESELPINYSFAAQCYAYALV